MLPGPVWSGQVWSDPLHVLSVCVCFQSVEGTPLVTLLKDPYILISAGEDVT